MSLKAFHVVFITISTLFLAALGLWGVSDYFASTDTLNLMLGVVSLAGSVGLVWYETWFLAKYKKLSYL